MLHHCWHPSHSLPEENGGQEEICIHQFICNQEDDDNQDEKTQTTSMLRRLKPNDDHTRVQEERVASIQLIKDHPGLPWSRLCLWLGGGS